MEVNPVESQEAKKQPLTSLEKLARKANKQNIRFASYMPDNGGGGANVKTGMSNFYSPQLSTDFLELPQSEREKRELFRFWYNCFVPGTPITMIDGTTRSIEDITVGDAVSNGFGEPTVVVETFKQDIEDNIYEMKVRGIQQSIKATGNHPFYVLKNSDASVLEAKPCFINLCDIRPGDFVVSPRFNIGEKSTECSEISPGTALFYGEHRLLLVESVSSEWYSGPIYNFEVNGEGDRKSYIAHGLSTHNTHPIIASAIDFHCFPPGAPVMLPDGSIKEIQSFKIGDEVLNGFGEPTKVLQTFAHDIYAPITRLTVVGVSSKIDCTENHPWLTYRSESIRIGDYGNPSFMFAKDLQVGDYICSPFEYDSESSSCHDHFPSASDIRIGKNLLRRIEKTETVNYDGPVYNIEVEGDGDRKSYIAYGLATHNTDVPMSKIRLSLPKGKDLRRNKQIHHFYMEMVNRIKLFQVLYDMTHEYWLHGNVFPFVEDHDLSDSIPQELLGLIKEEHEEEPDFEGVRRKKVVTKPNPVSETERSKKIRQWVAENYRGWERIQILPPEQVKLEVFQYTHRVKMELIPSEKDRMVVMKAADGMDEEAIKIAEDIPDMIKNSLLSGEPIPLNSSPYDDFLCSSFCYHLSHKKSAYDDRGISLLERCLRTLNIQDKLRQAQTSIASRAMTPKRVVWADKMSEMDTEMLRDQVEQALQDPDFSMVTNFEVHWDEIGARDRLLDLTSEYENSNKMLYIGLRITESMLTGESTYSGERIHLDVMNTMYLLYRERISEFVEEYLFKPVAEKKGFFEEDEYGNRILLYPKLQFTRLALRDNSELQDYMFNLYQKGSLPISFILDLINIDPDDAIEQLKLDALTFNDPNFNEFLKRALEKAGDEATEKTDILEKIFKNAGLKYTEKQGDRFGKDEE
jgi:hypothetical protein